ncbi:MAG: ABC transporter ATP-binding protein [bacterium]
MPLLSVQHLTIEFRSHDGLLRAVDNISFDVQDGETLAIVGESGSGKSVTALSLTRLLPPPPVCRVEGKVLYQKRDLLAAPDIRSFRGKEIAYIFQEPSTSLNPVFTIGFQIEEAVQLHRPEIKDRRAETARMLELVGIPAARAEAYPHQLSGGMQQRAMIAMALASHPKILVADEPTTALDVTIQAQIISLLKELKQKLGMTVILITHNFGIVSNFADRTLVMFRGKIVEQGRANDVLARPQHAYTRALMDCIPRLGQAKNRLTTIDYAKL